MKPSLVDTDTLSFFFKGHPSVVSSFEAYSQQYAQVNLSIITYYEILSGLKHRDANKKLEVFLDFAAQNTVLSLTEEAATIASEYYATLCKQGQPLEDIDLLIAGIALSNNLVLITHNTKHFERIEGIEIADWALDFHKRTENTDR